MDYDGIYNETCDKRNPYLNIGFTVFEKQIGDFFYIGSSEIFLHFKQGNLLNDYMRN
jgi:hypothetical protein